MLCHASPTLAGLLREPLVLGCPQGPVASCGELVPQTGDSHAVLSSLVLVGKTGSRAEPILLLRGLAGEGELHSVGNEDDLGYGFLPAGKKHQWFIVLCRMDV